jgi:predicted Zn-dependent protease
MRIWLGAAVLAAWSLGAQERPPGTGVNFYSREKEAALGAALARQVREQTTLVENPAVLDYVQRLAARLAAQLPPSDLAWNLQIIASQPSGNGTQEPVWLPGGYVLIPARLFLATQDEAEFAGMLAHVMAHVVERHGTRAGTRAQLVNYAAIPLVFMGGWVRSGSAVPLGFLTFARAYEREADLLAVHAMARAGFDPAALARYIERTQVDPKPPVYSSWPARDDRLAGIKEAIGLVPQRAYSTSPEFAQMQELMRGQ